MQLNEILKQARKEKKLTLKQLGELSNISYSQIGKIERGEHMPTRETIIKLTEALNLDSNKLLQIAGYNVITTTEDESFVHLRYKIFKKYNFTCQICGHSAPSVPLSISHILPNKMNGEQREDNLTVICNKCNIARKTSIQIEGLSSDPLFKRCTKNSE